MSDFLEDDDELEDDGSEYVIEEDEEDEESREGDTDGEEDESLDDSPPKTEEDYMGKMTKDEIWLSSAYDDISISSKKNDERASTGGGRMFDANIIDAVRAVLGADPKNTSSMTIESQTKELFQTQGHNRIPASVYVPDQPLRGDTVGEEFGGSDDEGFNAEFAKQAREQIAAFVKYLADRDLSKDSITSKKRKQRQLPALIIFLFSTGLYDLILNCPTLPEEYAGQVKSAFRRIQKQKYDIVEALAQRYESRGRDRVAERVRSEGISWFQREPAELRALASYADLDLDHQDIMDYREFRPRFINASKTITQDLISDMIEVVLDPKKNIYEKLKDKTRSDAIADVKKLFKEWTKENSASNSDIAEKIIWKDIKLVK